MNNPNRPQAGQVVTIKGREVRIIALDFTTMRGAGQLGVLVANPDQKVYFSLSEIS